MTTGSRVAQTAMLTHAAKLGEGFLFRGEAVLLLSLTGEVPTWDWKKLNRPATFKKKFKVRSFKIQDVLAKLLKMFTTNLEDATTAQATLENVWLISAEEALEQYGKRKRNVQGRNQRRD